MTFLSQNCNVCPHLRGCISIFRICAERSVYELNKISTNKKSKILLNFHERKSYCIVFYNYFEVIELSSSLSNINKVNMVVPLAYDREIKDLTFFYELVNGVCDMDILNYHL